MSFILCGRVDSDRSGGVHKSPACTAESRLLCTSSLFGFVNFARLYKDAYIDCCLIVPVDYSDTERAKNRTVKMIKQCPPKTWQRNRRQYLTHPVVFMRSQTRLLIRFAGIWPAGEPGLIHRDRSHNRVKYICDFRQTSDNGVMFPCPLLWVWGFVRLLSSNGNNAKMRCSMHSSLGDNKPV